MKTIYFLLLFLTYSLPAQESLNSFSWMETLTKNDQVNICGSPNIQNTKNSLRKNFFLGNPKKGYAFTNLLSHADYWKILKEENFQSAKSKLEKKFNQAVLWEISPDGTSRFLGPPKEVKITFKSSVKDCTEGKPRYEGDQCKHTSCCSEKFPGVVVLWKFEETEYKLDFSPDPSVALVVTSPTAKRRDVRFCHITEPFKWKSDLHTKYRQECALTSKEFVKNLPNGNVDVWCADGGKRKDFGPMAFDVLHAMSVAAFYEKRLDRRKSAFEMLESFDCKNLSECKEFLYLLDWGIKSTQLIAKDQNQIKKAELLRDNVKIKVQNLNQEKVSFRGDLIQIIAEDKKCKTDEQCKLVPTSCSCSCGEGVSHLRYLSYLSLLEKECKNYQGPTCKILCPGKVKCITNECTYHVD
jgi:hypothetical protein